MVMEMERTRRLRQRRMSSSSSLVMAAAAAAIAGVALLATCCRADLAPVIGGGSVGGGNDASSRRTRGEGSLRGGGFDINDNNNNSYSATTAAGVNDNLNGMPKTFLIKFRDGLAQTRSLEIHHSSRRRRRQRKQQHRATRGEQGQTQDHDRKKWQSRAKSIASISDERHIAIVEMMDPDSFDDNHDNANDVAAVTSSTASEIMYDELMADEDVELVEEV